MVFQSCRWTNPQILSFAPPALVIFFALDLLERHAKKRTIREPVCLADKGGHSKGTIRRKLGRFSIYMKYPLILLVRTFGARYVFTFAQSFWLGVTPKVKYLWGSAIGALQFAEVCRSTKTQMEKLGGGSVFSYAYLSKMFIFFGRAFGARNAFTLASSAFVALSISHACTKTFELVR